MIGRSAPVGIRIFSGCEVKHVGPMRSTAREGLEAVDGEVHAADGAVDHLLVTAMRARDFHPGIDCSGRQFEASGVFAIAPASATSIAAFVRPVGELSGGPVWVVRSCCHR